MKKIAAAAILLSALPLASFAHEGHGHTHGFTITHYIVEPDHAILTWSVLALTAGFIWLRRRNKANQ
jgi:hypothetical protein